MCRDASGKLSFAGKAVLHGHGVEFSGSPSSQSSSYRINLAEIVPVPIDEGKEGPTKPTNGDGRHESELGRGQYGVVTKVLHVPTGITMAMKQIRLDINDATFRQILMELDILHCSSSPYIVEFYGAFFVESCVYYCMEYMDAGSLDKLYPPNGIDEPQLSQIAHDVVQGLKFLKDSLSCIHRDVKPSNILLNLQGQVKLCDFGVSGKLSFSMAKTNIGCQSYMAPERIAVPNDAFTYTVASDVWSLGMTIWESAMGFYPFSNERYDSMFAQLNAIVNETTPPLDSHRFSETCQDFVSKCLDKDNSKRPAYSQLLKHSFISDRPAVDMKQWATQRHSQYLLRRQQQQH